MDIYDFELENIRFSLKEDNTLIFLGWYREDNPAGRTLSLTWQGQEIPVSYDIKKGVAIRQKYLNIKAGISEEIRGTLKLPEDWKETPAGTELCVYCHKGDKKTELRSFTKEWLIKQQGEVTYNIETDTFDEDHITLIGWAAGKEETEFQLTTLNDKPVEFQLTKNYRRDVNGTLEELPDTYEAGFQITIKANKHDKFILKISSGDQVTSYHTSNRLLGAEGKEPGLVGRGIRYMKRYGLGQAVKKTKSKLMNSQKADDYKTWTKRNQITSEEIEEQRRTATQMAIQPKFSIVIPLYRTKPAFFRAMVDSILDQTYPNWELCLADGSVGQPLEDGSRDQGSSNDKQASLASGAGVLDSAITEADAATSIPGSNMDGDASVLHSATCIPGSAASMKTLCDGKEKTSPLYNLLEEYRQKDGRIHYQVLATNGGISANTNAAIGMATGDFVILCDHDDLVPANALYEIAKAINEAPETDIVYTDEDKVDLKGKKFFDPHFKSGMNIDLLCSMNYICHLFAVRKSLLEELTAKEGAPGLYERPAFDGAQDHDFILRCVEQTPHITRVPKILYHWRCHPGSTSERPESKLYAFEAGTAAVQAHYDRLGIPATVTHGQFYGSYKTTYRWEEEPLISILIPNKDHIDDLKTCISSIQEKSTYKNYEILVIENNSTEEETFAYYKELEKAFGPEARADGKTKQTTNSAENTTRDQASGASCSGTIRVLYYKGEFNFSRINNFGAKEAKGDYLLLLNNDTELISPDGLSDMLGYCMRKDVGIVGARLYYKDDTVQHGGVVLGYGGIAGHAFIGCSRYDAGYFSRAVLAQDMTAVTAACMMTKKSVYQEVGGLTEDFRVAFNDIDYCMKVRAMGKLVVYDPAAELYHYESKSRGLEDTSEKVERFNSEVERFITKWDKELREGDPYYNPNLSLDKADFSLDV